MRICLILSRNGSRRRLKGNAGLAFEASARGFTPAFHTKRVFLAEAAGLSYKKAKAPRFTRGCIRTERRLPDTYYDKSITPVVKRLKYCRVTEEGKGVEP